MRHWIKAFRLRTLPLSLSCIITGTSLAAFDGAFDWAIFSLTLATTICLQILSNLANDYGDGIKGTDNSRIGEVRMLASGKISAKQFKRAIILFAFLCLGLGLGLLFYSFNFANSFFFFLIMGLLSIWAAIKYTVGESAYGYKGFGDIFVFLFFGILGTLGSYFLYTKNLNFEIILPASGIGLLATGVLNLNNMRDIFEDEKHGKRTVPVRMGLNKARSYHTILLISAILCFSSYILLFGTSSTLYIVFIPVFLVFIQIVKAVKIKSNIEFDALLKPLAINTFIISIFFGISYILFNYVGSV